MALNLTYRSSSNCIGWSNPSLISVKPTITSLSGYFSPAGATTIVVLYGTNFRNFSRIQFGSFNPTNIFITSNQIEFYVPISALPGTYPIQVFNDTTSSNVVMYTLDNASGYWYLDLATQRILNTNFGGVSVSKPSNSLFGASLISYADKSFAAFSAKCDEDGTPVYLNFIPQIKNNGDFNLSTFANDSVIMNYVNDDGIASAINLTFWDTNGPASGVRITPLETTVSGDLVVDGDLTVTGTIFCNSMFPILSDYRIKENPTLLDESYTIDRLKPIKYFNNKTKNEEIGFLAHEVQEVFPFLVNGEKDGENLQTLNYIGLIGVLVKEIQDLKREMKQLKECCKKCDTC